MIMYHETIENFLVPCGRAKFKTGVKHLYLCERNKRSKDVQVFADLLDLFERSEIECPIIREYVNEDHQLVTVLDMTGHDVIYQGKKIHHLTIESKLIDIVKGSSTCVEIIQEDTRKKSDV